MPAYFNKLIDGITSPGFLQGVLQKYHYGEELRDDLAEVAGQIAPLLRKEAAWESIRTKPLWEEVLMTLGSGLDQMQERYTEEGRLLQSYMLETLADELLLEGYHAYNLHVEESTGLHVARYHFPGSEEMLSLALLPEMLTHFSLKVECNPYFYLQPKKSVLFAAELTKEEGVNCPGICLGCGSKNCPNRIDKDLGAKKLRPGMAEMMLRYGYGRIFGQI